MVGGINIEQPQPPLKPATQRTHKKDRISLRRHDTPDFWLIRELPSFENLLWGEPRIFISQNARSLLAKLRARCSLDELAHSTASPKAGGLRLLSVRSRTTPSGVTG